MIERPTDPTSIRPAPFGALRACGDGALTGLLAHPLFLPADRVCHEGGAYPLEEDILQVTRSHRAQLESLAEEDLMLWGEVALLLEENNVRNPAALLGALAETLQRLAEEPESRPLAHRTVRTLFEHFPRLVPPYLAGLLSLVRTPRTRRDGISLFSHGALRLSSDPGLAQPFLGQAPLVARRRGVEFMGWWADEAFLLAESDWWAARGFLSIGGELAPIMRATDLAPLGELGVRIGARSRHGTKAFFRSLPVLRGVMTAAAIRKWVERALVRYPREEDLVLYLSCPVRRAPRSYFGVPRGRR